MSKQWQKSSTSTQDGGNSIEVRVRADGMIEIRESDDPDTIVVTTQKKFALWVQGVQAGEFDHFVDL
ncbi:DUF397 domain-containing protein [Kitasatospora sp. A2-31]|uniref:DUF397 domain-containing protein n=1 Tax=Kitasatospora sp. A2-31 TaxID=2916414 RepID=UPI001EE9F1A1|nr:DUF397 domain-containing protein [Kitasatospora sp. A2-31]MCG6494879.1 DUF397 domain-containing protein [Kitasatospora sp. A2-31]